MLIQPDYDNYMFNRLVHTIGVRFVVRLCVSCKRRSADSIERRVTRRKWKFEGNPEQWRAQEFSIWEERWVSQLIIYLY